MDDLQLCERLENGKYGITDLCSCASHNLVLEKEPIDKDRLDELAKKYADFMTDGHIDCEEEHWNLLLGFKAGYRSAFNNKAIEE